MTEENPDARPLTGTYDAAPDGSLVSAGGWCAPIEAVYDASLMRDNLVTITLPEVSTHRGGIFYREFTPAERAAAAAVEARTLRVVEQLAAARHAAVDAACVTALAHGWDVHVYDPPSPFDLRHANGRDLVYLRCIGIEFTPAKHPVPTIHHHPAPDEVLWDEEDW